MGISRFLIAAVCWNVVGSSDCAWPSTVAVCVVGLVALVRAVLGIDPVCGFLEASRGSHDFCWIGLAWGLVSMIYD